MMESIGKIIGYNFKPFANGGDIQKQREAFEEGKKMFQEGKVFNPSVKGFWVKKLVNKTAWNSFYSHQSSYCPLRKEGEGMWIGFLAVSQIPLGCEECEDEEIRQIDSYRKAYNIYPFPLSERNEEEIEVAKLPL